MLQYAIRRILLIIPTLVGVSLLVMAFVRLLPSDAVDILTADTVSTGGPQEIRAEVSKRLIAQGIDPVKATLPQRQQAEAALIGEQLREDGIDPAAATPAQRQAASNALAVRLYKDSIREQIGLDKSYFEQWWSWSSRAVRGDFGESLIGKRPVGGELKRRVPVSFELGIMAMLVSVAVALPVGIISAVKQDSWADYLPRGFAIAAISLPTFVVALVVLILAAKWWGYSFPLFYKDLWDDPRTNLELLIVPSIILGVSLSGSLMRITRAQMLEVLRQDYMRTAEAKGLHQSAVILRHGVRNAFIPVVTVIGLQIPVLVGGSLVLEQIFGIPGVAQYLFTAIGLRDFPAIMAVNMVVALTIVVTNLLVDLSYGYLDPRIRYG